MARRKLSAKARRQLLRGQIRRGGKIMAIRNSTH